ncbi:uncharacterized protein [Choristoneura fumiferana]|uniref:uncharacterized protein n=1 Tax=Choristoneura fumiferana TaxID=7141 RepID=UPI003D1538B3
MMLSKSNNGAPNSLFSTYSRCVKWRDNNQSNSYFQFEVYWMQYTYTQLSWTMTDTKKNEIVQMENFVGSISSSKESDAENVDAIKKYIEEQEQEILLGNSSHDLEPKIGNLIQGVSTKNKNELLKTQLDPDDSDAITQSVDSEITSDTKEHETSKEKKEMIEAGTEFTQGCQTSVSKNINKQELQQLPNQLQVNIQLQDAKLAKDDVPQLKNESPINTIPENQKVVDLNHGESNSLKETDNTKLSKKENNLESSNKSKLVLDCETKPALSSSEIAERPKLLHQLLTSETLSREKRYTDEFKCGNLNLDKVHAEETLAIATSVMDMILTDTEATINKKKVVGALAKQCAEQASTSVSLTIGSKVEAKDFSELWYPAQIVEVDCDEMEVLVQYDDQPKKYNEWISINSPRLRPLNVTASKPTLPTSPVVHPTACVPEPKVEDKQKVTFAVGERCLARWRDNRRFTATVHKDLGNGNYEVMFDDGFQWKCPQTRLHKLKETSKHDYPSFKWAQCGSPPPSHAGAPPSAAAAPAAPVDPVAPAVQALARVPLFHTHLFDPTRDYLGSKSERREMKRKLNIKEIFNIGQKRKKPATGDKEPKSIPVCNNSTEEIKSEIIDRPQTPEAPPLKANSSIENNSAEEIHNPITKRPSVRKKPFMRKKIKLKTKTKKEVPCFDDVKKEIPDAVAAIIGTVIKSEPLEDEIKTQQNAIDTKDSNANDIKLEEPSPDEPTQASETSTTLEQQNTEYVPELESKVENFNMQDEAKHEEVIDKIKEVITKLEDGINEVEKNDIKPAAAAVLEVAAEEAPPPSTSNDIVDKEKRKKSKVKKSKKLRLMQEKKEKKHVDRVKHQLEEMKKQVEAMRKQIMLKTEELASSRRGGGSGGEADAACLLPGEWCCRWVDGQPAGAVSEVQHDARGDAPTDKPPLPRRSVQVEDNRLPPGWTKHMVRRSVGHSAGKWDVVLVSPDNRRLHTKSDMRLYLENSGDESVRGHEAALLDFGIHLKLARRLGWVRSSADGAPPPPPPQTAPSTTSPLVKRRKLSLNTKDDKLHKRRRELKIKIPRLVMNSSTVNIPKENDVDPEPFVKEEATLDGASIKDGFVHVGSLKVQVIETLLRCPAEGCFKNFRNTMLLKMHIKHYHRELRKMMGVTPKVLDLAYARTRPSEAEMKRLKCEAQQRIIKVKLPRLHKRIVEQVPEPPKDVKIEPTPVPLSTPPIPEDTVPKPQDSPKLHSALVNKPTKRPKVLLPVRNPEPEPVASDDNTSNDPLPFIKQETVESDPIIEPKQEMPDLLDFETAISTHTVTRVFNGGRRERRRKTFAAIAKGGSEEEWGEDSPDSRSSSCGSPDSKRDDAGAALLLQPLSSPSNDAAADAYMFTESNYPLTLMNINYRELGIAYLMVVLFARFLCER